MKLRTYVRKSTEVRENKYVKKVKNDFSIRLYISNGVIIFSPELCRIFKIEKYFSIAVHQDEENEDNWYIEFGGGDFTIYEINNTSLGFSSVTLVNNFFHHFKLTVRNIKCKLILDATEFNDRKLYQIDTSELVQK